MARHRVGKGLRLALLGVVGVAVFGFVVLNLWNWLMPDIFGWRAIGFWQAVGLVLLCRLLFGGFGGPGRGAHWRHRMEERWERMTPEEREKFREGLRGRCGDVRPPASEPTA